VAAVMHVRLEQMWPSSFLFITIFPGQFVLRPGQPIFTFVNRNLKPYRGYHVFMRALPRILKDHPNVKVVLVGGDAVSYGVLPPQEQTWRDIFFKRSQRRAGPQFVLRLLRDPGRAAQLGQAARKWALAHCDLQTVCLPAQQKLLERYLNSRL
jgi:glycosyltransferase involved in cell wall biosynthesis